MRRRYRILGGVFAILTLALASLAIALSHNSPCGKPDALAADAQRMKAIVYRCYGSTDVLRLEEIARPTVEDDQVLVRVRAAALNPLDWHYMTGTPYIMRLSAGLGSPTDTRVGVDFAGVVTAVGKNVTRFKSGDEVFGGRSGALAEYVAVREDRALALKPANVTFEQAGSVGIAAITALQGLRDHGRLQAGQKVLINGASGGVGTFAVQIARSMGAEVTAVCSTRNVELVRSIGADHVVDYKKEDFTKSGERYDLILDNVGNQSFSALRRVLKDDGAVVMIGGPKKDPWLGPVTRSLRAMMLSPFISQELLTMLAELNQDDLNILAGLMQAAKVTPVIDRRYTLSEAPAAMEYMGSGHARGKIVVSLSAPEPRVSAAPHELHLTH